MKRIFISGLALLLSSLTPALGQETSETGYFPPDAPQVIPVEPYAVSPDYPQDEVQNTALTPDAAIMPEFPPLPERPPIPSPPDVFCPAPLGNGQAKAPLAWRVQAFKQARTQLQSQTPPVARSPERYSPLNLEERAPY